MSARQTQVSPPQWMHDLFVATLRSLTSGHAVTCSHIANGTAVTAAAVAWKPNFVACPECMEEMFDVGGRERCCDMCGRDVPYGEILLTMFLERPPFGFCAAVCLHCAPDEALTDEQRTKRGPVVGDPHAH